MVIGQLKELKILLKNERSCKAAPDLTFDKQTCPTKNRLRKAAQQNGTVRVREHMSSLISRKGEPAATEATLTTT